MFIRPLFQLDCCNRNTIKLPQYESLNDKNLFHYFENSSVRKHLKKLRLAKFNEVSIKKNEIVIESMKTKTLANGFKVRIDRCISSNTSQTKFNKCSTPSLKNFNASHNVFFT